jgi:hypothetical protein
MRYQDFYNEGCEVLAGLITEAVKYYREHGLEISDRTKLYRLAEGLESLTKRHLDFAKTVLPDESKHRDDFGLPDGEVTEPARAFAEYALHRAHDGVGEQRWKEYNYVMFQCVESEDFFLHCLGNEFGYAINCLLPEHGAHQFSREDGKPSI